MARKCPPAVRTPISKGQVELLPIAAVRPYPGNARLHPPDQVRRLKRSIQRFGMPVPIIVSADDEIIAGHARFAAAKQLGWDRVPCLRIEHLSAAQERAYRVADNRISELASWDRDLLIREFTELIELDLEFDLEDTGFKVSELDLIIEEPRSRRGRDYADAIPRVAPDIPLVTRLGDLWLLGPHQLLCGDPRRPADFERLLRGEKAQLVFTDLPYGVPVAGDAPGLERLHHGTMQMAGAEMIEAYRALLASAYANLIAFSTDGAIHFCCTDWRHVHAALDAGLPLYSELKNICVWNQDTGGRGPLYRQKYEFILVWKAGDGPDVNNNERGRSRSGRANVWDYARVESSRSGRKEERAPHPPVKPVALVADAIRDCSKSASLVLDPFAGSGTTLIAAEKTGRRAAAIEFDPGKVDTAVRRWQSHTRASAIHADTGLSFAEMERCSADSPRDYLAITYSTSREGPDGQ